MLESALEPAARASGWCSCRSFRGLQFLVVLGPSSCPVGALLLPLGCLQGAVIGVTQPSLGRKQQLVIANRWGAGPPSALRYRKMGKGAGLDLRAHLLAAMA